MKTSDTSMDSLSRDLAGRLSEQFGDAIPDEVIEECARKSLATLRGAKIKLYVPMLAYHSAREQLLALKSTVSR